MTHTNGRVKIVEPTTVQTPQLEPAPAWFNVLYLSLAVFAGPTLFAAVIGLVYLASVVAGQTYALFRHSAG